MATTAPVDLRGWYEHPSSPIRDGNNPSSARAFEGVLDVAFGANRLSGVAPLAIQFDAGFNHSDASNQTLHRLYYLWDYDDVSSGNWINGKSRNSDAGFIGAHVFETAGTYNVGLTVIDAATGNTVRAESITITVTDPDTYYSGTNTICVNNVGDSDFTSAPAGALQVNSDDINSVMSTYFATDRRVLLKRGGIWTYSSLVVPSSVSNGHIGAYGTGTSPDPQGLFTNAPLLTATADTQFVSLSSKQNCRFTDLRFTSALTTGEFFGGAQNINNNLVMNCKASGGSMGVEQSNWRNNDSETLDGNFFVNNSFTNHNDYSVYVVGDRLCILGNVLLDPSASHTLRVLQCYKGAIRHNQIAGASNGNTNGRHALKLHGPQESNVGDFATSGNLGLPNRTQFVHIADNIFGSSPPWPVAIGPQNNVLDERLTDIVFERNLYESDFGTSPTGVDLQTPFRFSCRFATARNNISYCLAADSIGGGSVAIYTRGIEPTPAYIFAYNNTAVTDDTSGTYNTVDISSDADNCIAINNLLYAPNTANQVVNNSGTNSTVSNNLDSLTTPLVNPFNATPASRDYSLSIGSGAIDQGASAPVYEDYSGTQRTGSMDVGAYGD